MAEKKKKKADKDQAEQATGPVTLAIDENGPAVIQIDLAAELTLELSQQVRSDVQSRVSELSGRPFALLMDTRQVTKVEDGALQELEALEKDAAGQGLERIAHVVRFPEMKEKLAEQYQSLGYPDLIGTFTDTDEALQFLRGLA